MGFQEQTVGSRLGEEGDMRPGGGQERPLLGGDTCEGAGPR